MCRGQKHQRREKQVQHLDNSEELSHSAIAAVLSDDGERPPAAEQPSEHATNMSAAVEGEAGEPLQALQMNTPLFPGRGYARF